MLIFVNIFFLALIEEKLIKLLDQQNISRISGIRPYRISGLTGYLGQFNLVSGRIPDIKKAGLSGRISGWPDICCILILQFLVIKNR
jgi:hypothetical protein